MSKLTEEGRFNASVMDVEFGESNTGKPYINLYFSTEKGSIGSWLYLSDAALPGTLKTLRSAFEFDGNFETASEQIKGKECSITVEMEEYNNVSKPKVRWVNPIREVSEIPNQGSFLKSLSAKAKMIPKDAPKTGTKTAPAPKAKDEFLGK